MYLCMYVSVDLKLWVNVIDSSHFLGAELPIVVICYRVSFKSQHYHLI